MSDLVPATQHDAVLNYATGELVDAREVTAAANTWRDLVGLEQRIRETKERLLETFVEESLQRGTKTLHIEGFGTVEISGGPDSVLQWDVDFLEDALRAAGLPEDRLNALIKVEYTRTVNARVASQLASANPEYKEIIEAARTRASRKWSARVS